MTQRFSTATGSMDGSPSGVSIPDSDVESQVGNGFMTYYSQQQDSPLGTASSDFSGPEFRAVLSSHIMNGFSSSNGNYDIFHDPGANPSLGQDDTFDYAVAFQDFQACADCTPATKTAIPHHHHKSGRLAGASATLAGHFCCSWLIHDQPCFLCFESAEALDNHIKNDHAGKDGTYRCLWQDCSKHDSLTNISEPMNFGNKPKLMRHVHSHTGYKPFPCPFPGCDKGFVTKEQLRNHETTHTKSRKYKCEQCGKAFAVKSALTTHITAVHDEKKIHSCEICGKAFADSSNLSKHKQTHFRDNTLKKQRARRGPSSAPSTRSSPSTSTQSVEISTPVMRMSALSIPPMSPGLMGPPSIPKMAMPSLYTDIALTHCGVSTLSSTSSPPPDIFDPSWYCCDHCPPAGPVTPCEDADDCDLEGFCCDERCTPPNGLAAPCTKPENCDLDGFCDLPTCLTQDGYSADVSSHEPSTTSHHCDEPLLHHQIEQLRNFQMPSQWGALSENLDHGPTQAL